MKFAPLSIVLLAFGGCTPKNASITDGSFTAFLASSTSQTLQSGDLDLDGFGDGNHWAVDCRADVAKADRLDGALDICNTFAPKHAQWLMFDGFQVVTAPLEPWRGEAVMTSEGDLQITFHNALPGGEDFRFAFVVDPHFQPTDCVLDDNGETTAAPVDGEWISNWSADAGSGSLFYLNAGSYQFNPADPQDNPWILPDEWLAGFATARFSLESMPLRTARYGFPSAYSGYELDGNEVTADDLFYVPMADGADPTTDAGFQALIDEVAGVTDDPTHPGVVGDIIDELATAGVDSQPHVHTNEWRIPDGNSPGLDGWLELQYNWVRFDQAPEDLAAGNPASGEFNLVFDATESQSRLFVNATFEVDSINEDKFTTPDLEQIKLDEAGTVLCQ